MADPQENEPIPAENAPAAPISEDGIKRAVVPFLRHFYKNRYAISYGTERAEFDLEDAAGHRVDSRLTFNKEDGTPFTCAVEATAADNLGEVVFSLNRPYFIWACAASASFTLGIIYLLMWRFRGAWVYGLGWQGNIGLAMAVGGMLFAAYYFLQKGRGKFRYIYAVEQFKSYQADEKWVALSENAFPETDNVHLAELRKQLVFNGYGLLLVADDGAVRPLITPSRLGSFGENRKTFQYFLDSDFIWKGYQMAQSRPAKMLGTIGKKGWQITRADRLTDRLVDPTARFMRAYFHQKLLTGIGLCVVAIVIWRTRDYRAVDYVNETANREALLNTEIPYEGESYMPGDDIFLEKKPPAYLPDAPAPEPDLSGGPSLAPPENELDFFEKLAGRKPAQPEKRPVLYEISPKRNEPVKKAAPENCGKWAGRNGWVVQDNFFSDPGFAKERAAALAKNGLSCELVRRQCLYGNQSGGWATLLGGVFASEGAARSSAAVFQKKLVKLKLDREPVLVKQLAN